MALGAERFLLGVVGLDLRGLLSGSFEVTLGKTASHILGGKIDLSLDVAKVIKPAFKHKTMGLIVLTDTELGKLRIQAAVKPLKELPGVGKRRNRKSKDAMVIHFEELSSDSPELAFKAEPKSAIHFDPARSIGDATLDLHFAVHVKQAYLEKEGENSEGAVGKHNKIIAQAARMRLIPKLARVYRNGVFGVMCTGKLSKPDCDFKRTSLKFEKEEPNKREAASSRDRANRRKRSARGRTKASNAMTESSNAAARRPPPPPRADSRVKRERLSSSGSSTARTKAIDSSRINRPDRNMGSSSALPTASRNVTNTVRRTAPVPTLRQPIAGGPSSEGDPETEQDDEESVEDSPEEEDEEEEDDESSDDEEDEDEDEDEGEDETDEEEEE